MTIKNILNALKLAKINQTEAADALRMNLRTYQRKVKNESFTFEEGLKLVQLAGIKYLFYKQV